MTPDALPTHHGRVIRREHGQAWFLIPQPSHAALSGDMAERWRLSELAPRAEVVTGCTRHDDGWLEWEAAPRACAETGRPLAFHELPLDDHLRIWRRGPAVVARDDPYAGLLVSRHGEGLMEHKLEAGELSAAEAQRVRDYLDEQARFRGDVIRDGVIPEEHLGERFEHNVRLLQLLDYVSLVLCWRSLEARRLSVGAPEEGYRLDVAPAGAIEDRPGEGLHLPVRLDPWPFGDRRALVLEVAAHRVPKRRYDDDALREALAGTPAERLAFRFVAGEAS